MQKIKQTSTNHNLTVIKFCKSEKNPGEKNLIDTEETKFILFFRNSISLHQLRSEKQNSQKFMESFTQIASGYVK